MAGGCPGIERRCLCPETVKLGINPRIPQEIHLRVRSKRTRLARAGTELQRLTRHSFPGVILGTTLPLGNSLSHCEKWNKPRRFRAFPAFAMSHPRQLRLLTCNYPPTAQGVPLCLLSSEDSTSSVNVNCFASANPAVLTSIAQTLCHIYRRALESFYSRIGTCQ
jgi:hypothetical protein